MSYQDSTPRHSHESLAKRLAKSHYTPDKNHHGKGFDHIQTPKDPYAMYQKPAYDLSPSETNSMQLKNPKSVKDLFHRFSDNTSIQGLHFITTASKWYAKTLWSVIFIAAIGVWLLHSIVLIHSYIAFDTNSQVKISYEPLEFPTVTFCNINPIRKNRVSSFGSEQLLELLEKLNPRQEFRDRNDDDGGGNVSESQRPNARQNVEEEEVEEEEEADEDVDRNNDFRPFDDIEWSDYIDVGAFADFIDGDFASSVLAKLLIREMIVDLSDKSRSSMGHRLADMMLGCWFDGTTCSKQNFSRYLDINYGNCYSFNSADLLQSALISNDSGSNQGLDLVLYTQHRQYLKGLEQGRGVRLYVHPFGTQPFVEDSGVSVPTGFETFVGLRQVSQLRLGGRYGECGDDDEYERYYEGAYSYTLDACSRTCLDRLISKHCRCFRGSRKQFYSKSDIRAMSPCRTQAERTCVDKVKKEFDSDTLDCNCKQECRMTNYDYLFSYDNWPDQHLWHSLVGAACDTLSSRDCTELKREQDRESFLTKNFIHLKIYYRDLNIERINEVASYEDIQFYSDMGGAIGLWLGASVITIFELGDFFVRSIQFCCKRKTYQKRKETIEKIKEQKSERSISLPASLQSTPKQLRRVRDTDFAPSYQLPYSSY